MVITGEWRLCDAGIIRPVVYAKVLAADSAFHVEVFLVDGGADRSVFSADLLRKLQFSPDHPDSGAALKGVGGDSPFVLVNTALEFTKEEGGSARVRGQYAAFTDPTATDLSILGRDVLDIFDVIMSRRRNEVLLLAGDHRYRVDRS
jgi:hypothetical protein